MQIEEQQAIEEDENENSNNDNNARNNDESDVKTEHSQHTNSADVNLDTTDIDSDQTCPICMEQWTNSGEHRLCCLRCGHLFGHSCILRWLQQSCTAINRRCPQCNKKALVKHIRMLYAKKVATIDTTECDSLKKELINVTAEKKLLQLELSQYNARLKVYQQQVDCMRKHIAELESQQSDINIQMNQIASGSVSTTKFHLERSLEICKDSGCRVLDYNPWYKLLVVSQKSSNGLFNGYGIRKMDCEYFNLRQFVYLHTQAVRDVTFHSTQQTLLLSAGFDKCAKLMDIQNNMIVQTYQTNHQLWSCCWSGDNPHTFLAGAQNGSISQFDIRQTSGAISVLDSYGDTSPVVSMATVPSNPGSGISRGGFVACRLRTCNVYEIKDTAYLPKQMFLEGPFVSVRYDEKNHHCLISSRPNARQPYARHTVCTIEKHISNDDMVMCNTVHTFQAGNSQQLLSRPCYLYKENDTLVAAYIESNSNISLWSIASGRQLHSLPLSDSIIDLCSFEVNNYLFLSTLSTKRLRLYKNG
ncbi:E3 ubiquitin-protein ligase rfwd3.S-like isoform X2 [Linepithema humile]|nr:PREDICTED: E3 ubiquitin-protein ligase RFWD3-like isoform X2 [Linepithema humile]